MVAGGEEEKYLQGPQMMLIGFDCYRCLLLHFLWLILLLPRFRFGVIVRGRYQSAVAGGDESKYLQRVLGLMFEMD